LFTHYSFVVLSEKTTTSIVPLLYRYVLLILGTYGEVLYILLFMSPVLLFDVVDVVYLHYS